MNVEIEIYMSGIIKFFKDNPNELLNLVPEDKKEEFFDKIRTVAISNSEKGDEVSLTRQQLVDICIQINGKDNLIVKKLDKVIQYTPFGEYSLN
jgi:hypothetical protein